MNLNIYFISLILIFNFFFYYYFENISKILNIYDFPDKIRKKHPRPVALLGGVQLILNLSLVNIFNLYYEFLDENINSKILLFFCILVFIVGIIDDKFDIKVTIKFTSLLGIIYILII